MKQDMRNVLEKALQDLRQVRADYTFALSAEGCLKPVGVTTRLSHANAAISTALCALMEAQTLIRREEAGK